MAALVKGVCNDCRPYSHSCIMLQWTGNVILTSWLCVSRFLTLSDKGKIRCIIISLPMFLSSNALTPESLRQQCGTLDFPAVVQRGMAQLLISSVSSSFSQPKACRAGGGRGRRRRRKNWNASSLFPSTESFIRMGFFYARLEALACTLTHTPTHPACMSVCACVYETRSKWEWVANGVYMWVTLQACKQKLVHKNCPLHPSSHHPSIHLASKWSPISKAH